MGRDPLKCKLETWVPRADLKRQARLSWSPFSALAKRPSYTCWLESMARMTSLPWSRQVVMSAVMCSMNIYEGYLRSSLTSKYWECCSQRVRPQECLPDLHRRYAVITHVVWLPCPNFIQHQHERPVSSLPTLVMMLQRRPNMATAVPSIWSWWIRCLVLLAAIPL